MKRFRALAIITATVAIVAIPGGAQAARHNCVAETVQMFNSTFSLVPGAAADLIAEARLNPDSLPWCG